MRYVGISLGNVRVKTMQQSLSHIKSTTFLKENEAVSDTESEFIEGDRMSEAN